MRDQYNEEDVIFIPTQVISSKNSKMWTGTRLIKSKAAQNYIKDTKLFWKVSKHKFLKLIEGKPFPIRVEFQLIRKDKRRFDYVNLCQLPLDIMVWEGWLPDDNADYIIPIFKEYIVDKENPGIKIKVL